MKQLTPLSLTFVAGFVDTSTFLGADGIFGGHVTGTFALFGAALAESILPQDYAKLIAFPIFILSVGLGVLLYGLAIKHCWRYSCISYVLDLKSALLFITSGFSYFYPKAPSTTLLASAAVVAMALQNCIQGYLSGPITTVMTGKVMNWPPEKAERLFFQTAPIAKQLIAKPITGWMMLAFANRCVLLGFLTHHDGLTALVIPANIIAVVSVME